MKKLFTLIVAICATTLAWADASGSCGENVTYSFVESTGTLTISGTGAMKNYEQYTMPWKAYISSIEKVVIEDGVTSIGEYAFEGCTGLTSMTVEATDPPYCVNEWGHGLGMPSYSIPLYVPAGSVDAYKAEDEWMKFTNIQAIPATGVNEATVEKTVEKSEVKKIIDRNGIIYIEKDGTRYFLNGGKAE